MTLHVKLFSSSASKIDMDSDILMNSCPMHLNFMTVISPNKIILVLTLQQNSCQFCLLNLLGLTLKLESKESSYVFSVDNVFLLDGLKI